MKRPNPKKSAQGVLERYPREVALMHSQMGQRRLSLVLGAGFSRNLDFPEWDSFLNLIASDARINMRDRRGAHRHLRKGETLFQAFRTAMLQSPETEAFAEKHKQAISLNEQTATLVEAHIESKWLDLLVEHLYEKYSEDQGKRAKELRQRAEKSYHLELLTSFAIDGSTIINYNFDDSIELLMQTKGKQVHSTWHSKQTHIPNKVTVHHPNGFLPHDRSRGSTSVTLLESSFQNHINESTSGAHATFSAFLLENTCLFVGISLDDPGLCHHLHQCSMSGPGHVHFLTILNRPGVNLNASEQESIRQTLFELYNVIALFLDESEITGLALLLRDEDSLREIAKEALMRDEKLKYTYYLTGCVSSGKSTVLSHLSGFNIYGEWPGDMPTEMKDDPNQQTPQSVRRIDRWVDRQVPKKNIDAQNARSGINLFDRCPLDAFAFKAQKDWSKRAKSLRKSLGDEALFKGEVVLIIGEPHDMCVRSIRRNKDVDRKWLSEQQDALMNIYLGMPRGVRVIDSRGRSLRSVLKDVIRIFFFVEYDPADLDKKLMELETHVVQKT